MRFFLYLTVACATISSPVLAVDPPAASGYQGEVVSEPAIEAEPRSNPGDWVTPSDYPAWALRQDVEGLVQFRLIVGTDGRATDCQITESSGVDDLDRAACEKLLERAEFRPAYGEDGKPVVSVWESSVRWQIPEKGKPAPPEGYVSVNLVVEKDGKVSSCKMERAEGAAAEADLCPVMKAFKPILDEDGNPVRKRIRILSRVVHEDIPQ